ncbi:MAG: metallophosphoesterase [Defluviitaleaceae bacterium]|nr:metallophosphoesterase [Defluviitaleaceae bacterium]MCL2238850.1 metallophosphoesterase [Defluviitaleaceae bacterium]
MSILTWLHISDFHFGKADYGERDSCDKIIELAHELLETKSITFDAIFITGDIAYKGIINQYEVFKSLVVNLSKLYDEGKNPNIYIVPGNHDVNRDIHPLINKGLYALDGDYKDLLNPTPKGLKLRELVAKRFEGFKTSLNALPCHPVDDIFGEKGFFIDKIESNGNTVGIAGINTAWLAHNSKEDDGKITPGQNIVKDLVAELKKYDYKILLGHHPMSFFKQADNEAITSLLAKHGIIYLCGHLHKSAARYQDAVSGYKYLSFNTGAAFLPNSNELQCSMQYGILDETHVTIGARRWESSQSAWILEDSRHFPERYRDEAHWNFPLLTKSVKSMKPKTKPGVVCPKCPKGWKFFNREIIEEYESKEPNAYEMGLYFDGAPPEYSFVFSPTMPIRKKAGDCIQEFLTAEANEKSKCMLLCGAGSEGKSTFSLQVISKLIKKHGWVALHCREPRKNASLNFAKLESITSPLIIVVDNASLISGELYAFLEQAERPVHMLLVSVWFDWINSKSDKLNWRGVADYSPPFELNGIDESEAREIVEVWSKYEGGLGRLAKCPNLDVAADKLFEASKGLSEKKGNGKDGALLGAIIKTRYEEKYYKERVSIIMERLNNIQLGFTDGTLRDVFLVIAAMHEKDISILTADVLAEFYECSEEDIRKTLRRLGKEAVTRTSNRVIYVRHFALAECAVKLAEEELGILADDFFPKLATMGVRAGLKRYNSNLKHWRSLANRFLTNDKNLAVRIAESVCNEDKDSIKSMSHFLMVSLTPPNPRYDFVYTKLSEWPKEIYEQPLLAPFAIATKLRGDNELNAYLNIMSISDIANDVDGSRVEITVIRGIHQSAKSLFEVAEINDNNEDLIRMGFAFAKIWQKNERKKSETLDPEIMAKLNAYNPSNDEIKQHIEYGMEALLKLLQFENLPQSIPRPSKITFDRLLNMNQKSKTRDGR